MTKEQIKVDGVYETTVGAARVHVRVTFISSRGVYNTTVVKADTAQHLLGRKVQYTNHLKFKAVVGGGPKRVMSREELGLPMPSVGKTKTEGEQCLPPTAAGVSTKSPDTSATPAAPVPERTAANADEQVAPECMGYKPSKASAICRCEGCKKLPVERRTRRPFVVAHTVDPGTSPTGADTTPSAPFSPRKKPPAPLPTSDGGTTQTKTEFRVQTDHGPMLVAAPSRKDAESRVRADGHKIVTGKMVSVLGSLGDQTIEIDNAPHIIVDAKAGTGKTTTMIEGLKRLLGFGTHITPSPQQQAVWDSLEQSKGKAKTIGFTAFNKSIVTEIKHRIPPGVTGIGIHGMGFKAVNRAFRLWGGDRSVSEWRVSNIIEELMKGDIRNLRRSKGPMIRAVQELVGLCKVNLIGVVSGNPSGCPIVSMEDGWDGDWWSWLDQLVDHFDIDMDRYIDYDDMIWLPVVLRLPVDGFDVLVVDESQDMNRCQHALVRMAGERLILVGDPRQAIYGFAGADHESMKRMAEELGTDTRGCVVLPLSVTRRCGKAIVAEANKIVPEFSAHETNCDGRVSRMSLDDKSVEDYRKTVLDGDMVLCRVNAPLVSECFRFIKAGCKATIQGRDVGKGLVQTVEKQKAGTVAELVEKLQAWHDSEIEKEGKKKFPSEAKIVAVGDKLDCLMAFISDVDSKASPALVVEKINAVFTDDKGVSGIRLSSIHKSKGLEAKRVFLLEPAGCGVPHPMAKLPWEVDQEWNLRYVAITRAIDELVFVS
jgi:hypothetical protein